MVMANPRSAAGIAFILASVFCISAAHGAEPPPDLARRVAAIETRNRDDRGNFTYRQTVTVEEVSGRGNPGGRFHEVRDIIFSPGGERTEQVIGSPLHGLNRLQLTEEDFRDIREIQPFLFTSDQLWAYQVQYKGEEPMDGVDCWVLEVRPRQILDGQRLFDGMLWVSQKDMAVVRSEGKAVPDLLSTKTENLFPRFTTRRERVDGEHWFPVYTLAEDTLAFRNGPLKMRMKIEYSNYKRFKAESTIEFKEEKP
jgi:hypothetical protein